MQGRIALMFPVLAGRTSSPRAARWGAIGRDFSIAIIQPAARIAAAARGASGVVCGKPRDQFTAKGRLA